MTASDIAEDNLLPKQNMLHRFNYFKPGVCPSEYLDNDKLLANKVAIITGANLGLGLETTKSLFKLGAHVILACRDETKAKNAIETLQNENKDATGSLEFIRLDLCDFSSVVQFAEQFKKKNLPLNLLVNNAGIQIPGALTKDGIEINFQTNHLSHYLLTRLLFDKIIESNGRVVVLSSFLHQNISELWLDEVKTPMKNRGFEHNLYSHSKLCNVLFARELQKQFGDRATVVTVNPGVVHTGFVRNSHWMLTLFYPATVWMVGKNVEQGVQTQLYCCVAPDVVPGGYYVDCKLTPTSRTGESDELAHELWVKSEELVKDYL